MKPPPYKKTKLFNSQLSWIIKGLVAVIALAYIVMDVYNRVQLHDTILLYKASLNDKRLMWAVPLILILFFANWSLEVLKWRWMMRKIEDLNLLKAFRAVFTGLTVSFFTPNRVGEYAGRVLFLTRGDRIKGILITILSSFSQLMITITIGLICLVFYMKNIFANENPLLYYIFISLTIFLAGLMLLLYFNIRIVDWLFRKWHVSRKLTRYTNVFQYYSGLELMKVMALSLLRYMVFSSQFYIILQLFHVEISWLNAFEMMALTYLTIAIVPTFALTEIGVRGSASLYFFGSISSNIAGILTASLTVWIINIALPSAIGALCVLYIKVSK